MRKMLVVSNLLAVLILISMPMAPVLAIESSGIGALPAHPRSDNPRTKSIFVYDVESKDVVNDGIKLVNNTDSVKTLLVYPVDSQASSDGAFACAQQVDERKEVGSWIKLAQDKVVVAANSSQTVPFVLTVPANSKAGEHNGCLVVQNAAPATQKTGNIVLSFRSALRVAVTTPGALTTDLSFVDVQGRTINQTTVGVSPILKNTGNVSADTHIDVRLTGLAFKYVYSTIDGQFPIFPSTESRFNFELKKPFWGGWYNRDVQARYRKQLSSGQLSDTVTNIKAKNTIIFIKPQPKALAIELAIALLIVGLIGYGVLKLWRARRLRSKVTASHTVQEGETIDGLANDFGIKWRQLAKINDIVSPYTLHVGQVIKVPRIVQPKPHKTKHRASDHEDVQPPKQP